MEGIHEKFKHIIILDSFANISQNYFFILKFTSLNYKF